MYVQVLSGFFIPKFDGGIIQVRVADNISVFHAEGHALADRYSYASHSNRVYRARDLYVYIFSVYVYTCVYITAAPVE